MTGREQLERDRARRERERAALADAYENAADALDSAEHPEAVTLLNAEAAKWRKGLWQKARK